MITIKEIINALRMDKDEDRINILSKGIGTIYYINSWDNEPNCRHCDSKLEICKFEDFICMT